MPELPEITVLARQMKAELVGKTFTNTEVLQPKCLNVTPQEFAARLRGARIQDVGCRGKWILVETNQGWLLLNLGMGGEILLATRHSLPEKYRLILDFSDGTSLVINHWWFGQAHFVPLGSLDQHPMTAKLGPNALDLSLEQFRELLRGRRGGIKSFLLNQSRIAGIGNVYIQDPLFKAGVHPLRPINSLSDDEIAAIWQAIRETLQQSIDHGGSAWEMDLHGEKGRWDDSFFLVAYREGQPCPVCETTVEKIKTGSTAGFVCQRCQPLREE
jgi:formamidopyrimidine-DNA glycosylase